MLWSVLPSFGRSGERLEVVEPGLAAVRVLLGGVREPEPGRGSAPALALSAQGDAALTLPGEKQNVRGNFGSGVFRFSWVLVSQRPGE